MTITEKPTSIIETHSMSSLPNPVDEFNVLHNSGEDISTFSKIVAIYSRNCDTMELHCIEQRKKFDFDNNWDYIKNVLQKQEANFSSQTDEVKEYVITSKDSKIFNKQLTTGLKISEFKRHDEKQIRGCILKIGDENPFNDWFVYHILDQARLSGHESPLIEKNPTYNFKYDEIFSDFFAANMKNTIHNDEWDKSGRSYFMERVRYFTDRYLKIECILPAFPCKSSNVNKVTGTVPDKGEEFALKRLIKVTQDVKEIYPPGMKIWIVSDGHVFSDCIGVDDDVVDNYTARLHELYEKCKIPGVDAVAFCGLNDLFFSGVSAELFDPSWVQDIEVLHYTGTKISSVSDISRQILMKGCDTDDGTLRKEVNIPGHPRLNLYRGFSRFMMEDLILLPFFEKYSKKGFKKIVSKIAFNMIKRNDAYSNLVELLFPHHLRISIHAHKNSGPKFGIKVISQNQCRMVKDLNDIQEPTFEDLLHIPTPWHNCIVKVVENSDDSNGEQYYLTKSKVIKEAIAAGKFKGEWKDSCFIRGEGGHYVIARDKVTSVQDNSVGSFNYYRH